MIYEKKMWTSGDAFYDINHKDYVGYIGVVDGKAYKFPTGEELFNRHTYLSNFILSDYFFDRIIDDELSLPYNKHQVTFAANDFLNKSTVRTITKRLLENNHFLFRCSNLSSPSCPQTSNVRTFATGEKQGLLERVLINDTSDISNPYNSNLQKTKNDPTFFSSIKKKAPFDLFDVKCSEMCITGISEIDNTKLIKLLIVLAYKDKLVFIRTLTKEDNTPFATDGIGFGTSINFSNEDENIDTLVINRLEPSNKNSTRFLNISNITIYNEELYVTDEKLNALFKYDISQLQNNSNWTGAGVILLDSIQNATSDSVSSLKHPLGVAVSNDYVYIADTGNHIVKKYSRNLDFIKSIKCGIFATQEIKAISSNNNSFNLEDGTTIESGSLWVISKSTNHVYLTIISNDKVLLSKQIHGLTLSDDLFEEDVKSIHFSHSDSNYYFISTNKRVLKLHCSRPTLPFCTIDPFNASKIVANNVWRKTSFKWGGDITSIWGQSAAEWFNMKGYIYIGCFSVCGYDKTLSGQFNGDIMFNIMFNMNKVKIKNTIETLQYKNFFDFPSYLKADSTQTPYILLFNDIHRYEQLLANTDFLCFDNTDITEINDSEYIDTLTLNKCLYKIAYNLITFKNLIKGRFWGYYDNTHLMRFDTIVPDTVFSGITVDSSNDPRNFFVHPNEPNTIIINRTFECIWNIQNQICRYLNVVHKTASTTSNQTQTIID